MIKGMFPQKREDAKRVKNVNISGLNTTVFRYSQIIKIYFAPLRLERAARAGVR